MSAVSVRRAGRSGSRCRSNARWSASLCNQRADAGLGRGQVVNRAVHRPRLLPFPCITAIALVPVARRPIGHRVDIPAAAFGAAQAQPHVGDRLSSGNPEALTFASWPQPMR
jgi:hypothetical protein